MMIGEIDFSALQYDFVGLVDGFFDDKKNDEIQLRHLLYVCDDLEYGYILDDLYNRLIFVYDQSFDEEKADMMLDCILDISVNRCEYLFRLFMTDGVYCKYYPNLAENGYIWAIVAFGYVLPYYVVFDETTDRLSIDIERVADDRPPTSDKCPHGKAVHYAHRNLDIVENLLDGKSPLAPYQLANDRKKQIALTKFKVLEDYYLELLPEFRRDRVTQSTKQTKRLLEKHNYDYRKLGYEHSSLVKKVAELNKRHFKKSN